MKTAARRPSCSQVTTAVLKLDAEGAYVAGQLVPQADIDVVDTTGAGDSFAGAFLASWLAGADAVAAARAAAEVAGWVVQRVGSRPPGWPPPG